MASEKTIQDLLSPGRILARIGEIGATDKKRANDIYNQYISLTQDPNSGIYNPYSQATNQSVSKLQSYGIDTSKLNDDWFKVNDGWIRSNLEYRGRTNSPSAPIKSSTKNNLIAYELYQYQMAEKDTREAEKQLDDALWKAQYWALRTDRNYSDDEIIAKVRENLEQEFPMLYKMEHPEYSLMEFNRGVNFSDDVIRGAIWKARNPDQKVGLEAAMAKYYMGDGNSWQMNDDISSKLDPTNPHFNPYAVGSTNLDDAAFYFSRMGFDKNWLKENDGMQWNGSDEDKKFYEQVRKAEESTLSAEAAVTALYSWMDKRLSKYTDPEKAKAELDKVLAKGKVTVNGQVVDLRILNDMDASIGKNGEPGTGKLIPMTRGVNYKYSDVVGKIEDICAKNAENALGDGSKFVTYTQNNWMGEETPDVAAVIKQAQDEKLQGVTTVYEDNGTEAEQGYVANAWSSSYNDVKDAATATRQQVATDDGEAKTVRIVQHETKNVQKDFASNALPSYQTVTDYEQKKATRALVQQELETLAPKFDTANVGDIGRHEDTVTYDGQEYKVSFAFDGFEYHIESVTDASGNAVDDETMYNVSYNSEDVNRAIQDYNAQARDFEDAQKNAENLSDEEMRYRELKLQLNDLDEYLDLHSEDYEESQKNLDGLRKKYDNQYSLMERHGIDTSDLYVEEVVLDYVSNFSNYEATVWSAYNPSDMYRTALAMGDDRDQVYAAAEKGNQEVLRELENAKAAKQYLEELGANIPKNYIDNLDRHIAKLERDAKDYEYFALSKNDDFKEIAQKGRQEEFDSRPLPWKILKVDAEYGWDYDEYFQHMDNDEADMTSIFAAHGLRGVAGPYARNLTEDEKDTYYYLMGKGEKAQAIDYVKSLIDGTYGVAQTRYMQRYSEELEQQFTKQESLDFNSKEEVDKWVAENGEKYKDYRVTEFGDKYYVSYTDAGGLGSFLGQNALAILASPASSMMSLIYSISNVFSGQELNPDNLMLAFNNFRTKTREESAKEIELVCGKGTAGQKVTQMFYEMVTNRLDSLMNSATFGAPELGGKYGGMASEFVGAMPMGMSAAMDSMARAKRQGASDGQAWWIGSVTFVAETATEAISLENIREAKELGKDLTADTVKDFLRNWLTKAGPSEMLGESINDIFENITDSLVMGEMSEHNNAVWQYRLQGYNENDAEVMALRDEVQGVLRTAVMSYLSPGMDIVQTATSKATNYIGTVRSRRQENPNASIAEVINGMRTEQREAREARQAEEEARAEWLNADIANGEGEFNLPETEEQRIAKENARIAFEEAEAQKAAEENARIAEEKARIDAEKAEAQKRSNAITVNFEVLETASKSDVSTQTAAIASVMDTEGTIESSDMANAAAVRLGNILGEGQSPTEYVQDLLMGANIENVDVNRMLRAVENASLGGEESVAYRMMQSPEFQKANPGQKVQMLDSVADADQDNQAVQSVIAKNIFENRVAEAEKGMVVDGAMDEINALQEAADDAAIETYTAEELMKDKQEGQKSARDAVIAANTEFLSNPSDDNLKMRDAAISALQAADAVLQEYEQHLKKAQQKQEKAEAAVKQTTQDMLAKIRQMAIDVVNAEDANRNVARQQAQAEAQVQAEQQAEQQAINDVVESSNAMDVDDFIARNHPNATEEERQQIRDAFAKVQSEMPAQTGPVVDENGQMTPEAIQRRDRFIKQVSKKFGVDIQVMDTTHGGTVDRVNGYYDRRNNRIVLDQNSTTNDAMFFVLGHELTHIAEQSETYDALAESLIRMRYGTDEARLAADIRAKKALYDERLARMHEQDETVNASPITEEEASQEIIADIMGDLLRGDQQLIDQLVAEEPSTARRILNAIKSFLRRAAGMKGEWKSQAQQTVDLLEKALKDAQGKTAQEETRQENTENRTNENILPETAYTIRKSYYSDNPTVRFNSHIPQTYINRLEELGMKMFKDSHGWGMRVGKGSKATEALIRTALATPIDSAPIYDSNKQEIIATELPGGTVAINDDVKYSLSSLTEEERQRIRQGLLSNNRFTTEEVDKYLDNVLSLASIVASDRVRLDFTADPEKTMLKPNAEYVKTLDASTLCAKRLLYQGTFDAIQHALPNTPLLPEDLIDLANLMREMGYETPCGICYVESRRRQLGNFTDQWLSSYEGEYKPSVDEVTTSDGLERLRIEHPQTYQDFVSAMNKKGTMNPKVVQLRTDYRGEIRDMTPGQIQKVKDIGGLRIQSFSDFETPHLLDMVQAVMDMASKDLTAQAYTKVPNFPWAFGDTGIKINLSLIGKGTGLDENGNLVFDDVEGMPFEEAMRVRDRYSQNVGTILVGINDAHILAAMADDRIDFIIPFHKSGWSESELDRMPVLNSYSDYTKSQNEKAIVGRAKDGSYKTESLDKSKRVNFQPVGENGYWDFSKTGKENAETYLKMCAEDGRIPKFSQFLVDNGDGSFSLQPDGSTDGYWKTLIDFKMYDNDGNGAPQQAVTPNINMNEAVRILNEYTLDRNGISRESNNDLPVAQPVVDRYVEDYKANHPLDENRVRYSLPEDAPYLSAVERGETEEAQRMVDEKAREAGYTIKAFHGSRSNFTEFDPNKIGRNYRGYGKFGRGFYFSNDSDVANTWGKKGRVYDVYLKMSNPYVIPDVVEDGPLLEELNRLIKKYNSKLPTRESEIGSGILEDINNYSGEKDYSTNLLKSLGYDGVIKEYQSRNMLGATAFWDGSTEYVVFEPEQIKSSDPVVYDDKKNVVPLSERFNAQQKDIRYSLPSEGLLEQQIRQYLRNGGSLSNPNPNTAPAPRFNQPETGMGQRQWGRKGAQESDELFQEAKDYVLNNNEYKKDTNAAELNRAMDWIQGNRSNEDPDGYATSLRRLLENKGRYPTKDTQARLIAMMALAVAKGDINGSVQLADMYNAAGTSPAQALQARKIWKLMTPGGRVAYMRKMISDQQQQLNNKGINVELKLSDWIYQAAAYATKDGEFEKVRQAALDEIAKQTPANWKDRLRSLRMLSMLANPRTHVRNFIGNALFVPAVGLKNKIGAALELKNKNIKQGEYTKTLALASTPEIREFARQDARKIKDVLTGEAKFSEATRIKQSQSKLGKFLDWLNKWNSDWLEKEDWFFLRGHYRKALGGWMMANGYTVEQVQNNQALLEKGREYAINEAQKATYRDFNKTAQILNEVSRNGGVPGFVVDATLPFKKTPANILKRGLEYSPAGIAKALTYDRAKLKQYQDYQDGKLNALPEKAMSPNQVIDHIAAGLSGTVVTALGFLLAGAGWVTCGLDDDDDAFDKEKGEQEYAIKLFGMDVSYTMDWAAPMSMPFFVGAAIRNQMDSEGDFNLDEVINAFGNITEPVLNLSMLDGVSSLFRTSQYDDTDTLTQIGTKIATNYVSSYIPSVLGAVSRTLFDDKQRKVFIEQGKGTGVLGTIRYTMEQMQNKIPVLAQQNIAARDIWGNEKTSTFIERLFENFISPGYIEHVEDDPIINEMARVYELTGSQDTGLVPSDPPKSFSYTVGGVKNKVVLTDKEWDQYKAVRGQTAFNELTELLNDPNYYNSTPSAQAQMIKNVWNHADNVGKAAVDPNYDIGETESVADIARSSKISNYKTEIIKALKAEDYEAYYTMVEAMYEEYDDEADADSVIKEKIGNTFRDEWKKAYVKDDKVTMYEIETLLENTGYDFNIYESGGWADKAAKQIGW